MIVRQRSKALTKSALARVRAMGPPASPFRGREWRVYPACGTRSLSIPVCEPTNSTVAPLSLNLSATHSAGIACPPVPPPAIRIRGPADGGFDLSGSFTILRYPVEDAHGGETGQEARTAVAYERERHPGEREDDHCGSHVEDRLNGEHSCQASRHAPRHDRRGVEGYPEPGQRHEAEGGDHHNHTQEAEFLPDQGEDHVGPDLRHVGPFPACPRARAEETPGLYRDHGLDHLVTRRSEERRVGKECRSRWSPYH